MKRTVLRRSTESLIREAMGALANMPCGGVGQGGHTTLELEEAESAGRVVCGDAEYHQAQRAWLLLEEALENL